MENIENGDEGLRVPAAITDAGIERELNEDRYAVVESPVGSAWLVCDGMGGVTGGELAAQLAIDSIRRYLETVPAQTPAEVLKAAILEANRIIVLRRQNQAFGQMGTTIVAAMFAPQEVVIANVGDSRAYLIRNGAIQQLTTDHTYVQELVEKGVIRQEEALTHPEAHILTRCMGAEPGLVVSLETYYIWQVPPGEPQDMLLLCTDGLYSLITEEEIASVVASHPPQRACVTLVELAKSRGGYDNITLAVIPLGGQLKEDPPAGYTVPRIVPTWRTEPASGGSAHRGLVRYLIILGVLTFLSMLLTVLIVTFWESR